MLIGISGCIGSGKSYFTNILKTKYHYDTFSADEFVREAYDDIEVKAKLDKAFKCVKNDKVDKEIIKSQLNDSTISLLNEIIHPFVIEKIIKLDKIYSATIAFVEVPLLFEENLSYLFYKTIAISCNEKLRHERLYNRDKENYQKMLYLESKQLSNEKKCSMADYIYYSDIEDLTQIDKIILNLGGGAK